MRPDTASLPDASIAELRALLDRREVSSVEATRAYLDHIGAVDGAVRAYLQVTEDVALQQAAEADARLAAGETGPVLGVPMALKDLISTEGIETTCGSRILRGYRPPYDATTYARLRKGGAVLLGKLNMDEFAMGSSNENSAFGITANPWDLSTVPGGSSGGSAAAVAAREAAFTLGSDTGGSVRQPAALCGVVGVKPTYGRVSRFGLIAFASSLDQIGPFTRTVEDSALVLSLIAGHDPLDSTSVPLAVPDYASALGGDLRGLRVGVPDEYFVEGIEPGVEGAVRAAIEQLESLGAQAVRVSLPSTGYALATYYIIAPSEASSNLARYDGVKYGYRSPEGEDLIETYLRTRDEGFGPEVKRRIMIGTYALSSGYYDAYYLKAQKVRTLIKAEFDRVFEQCDVIAAPTSPSVAFKLGSRTADPLSMYLSDVLTIPPSMAGIPAINVPCGFSDGLPVGLQLICKAFDEATMLRVAHAYERSTEWHLRRPPLLISVAGS
ncbi:MAG: Asp-tRNA(Asn)/Glu-tRNA(Gln) amidotransferase subunit GatA [Chloroflexota bacterium]|nr:Asp-tRNA(Asn)/Glu-tRNA(Gln) amidotransferase subunit GatA [Chloroflexota bacterium]